MPTIVFIDNILEPETYQRLESIDVCASIAEYYPIWPDSARIFHNNIDYSHDVTPTTASDVDSLTQLDGTLYVVNFPGEPISMTSFLVSALLFGAAAVVSYLLRPSETAVSAASSNNSRPASPNNALGDRQNSSRLNGRIPDIFGTVYSIPDLLSVPYKVFIDHKEVEYSYMCIGRGYYDVTDIKDDTTLISNISGASAEVYDPFTSPNSGDEPILRVGTAINKPVYSTQRISGVDGPVLRAPNNTTVTGETNIRFVYPETIEINSTDIDFTDYFEAGDDLTVTNSTYAPVSGDFNGTYSIFSVTSDTISLLNPQDVNASWTTLGTLVPTYTTYMSSVLSSDYTKETDSFYTVDINATNLIANFVAVNGLYKDSGKQQYAVDVQVALGATPIDANNNPTGAEELFYATVLGSSMSKQQRAVTLYATLSAPGRYAVRAWRVTETDTDFSGTVVDEVQWRDLYTSYEVADDDFGEVTTIQTMTYATSSALSIKNRKLNCIATRRLATLQDNGTMSAELYATNRIDDILTAIILDPRIGRRSLTEVDLDSIYDTISDVETYFGHENAVEFCYTFDDINTSFEETVSTVAAAAFCTVYRLGNRIKLSFEQETSLSTLLFNHRNKVPNTETRNVIFGIANDYDGIEYKYTATAPSGEDAPVTIYIPSDMSAVNPNKIDSVGIRNGLQAYFQAWRAYNKQLYTHITTSFEATGEANLLNVRDKILVADNTRQSTIDGEFIAQNGLVVTLSQDVDATGLTLFVQYFDGTVGTIPFTQTGTNELTLTAAPMLPLQTDDTINTRTAFMLANSSSIVNSFLVEEKVPNSNFTVQVTASNYDDRYYQNDSDYINAVVDEDGNII